MNYKHFTTLWNWRTTDPDIEEVRNSDVDTSDDASVCHDVVIVS